MSKKSLLLLILALSAVTPCMANPSPVLSVRAVTLGIAVEALIVALFLISGFYFLRVLFTWAGITTITWNLMVASLLALNKDSISVTAFIIAEIIVVLIETWLLRAIFSISRFRKLETATLFWSKAFLISLTANTVSLFIGFYL